MQKKCSQSGKEFEITPEDLAFYEKMGVPPPTLCPEERQRRRLAWRNERTLYHRTCDASGKKIVSLYAPEKPFPVYENEEWWKDHWDGKDYGQNFDFSRPFFEQFDELFQKVPKMARIQQGENENSTFCNLASWNKNCSDCFLCWNLRNKKYHIFNKPYSEEEYREKISEISISQAQQLFSEILKSRASFRANKQEKSENISGDHIFASKNTLDSYFVFQMEDVKYMFDSSKVKDAMDGTELFQGELQYETHACNDGYSLLCCSKCYDAKYCIYSQDCFRSEHLFGCIGLKNAQYCILNKQYSKEEYFQLRDKIIEHMQNPPQSPFIKGGRRAEWGEFFPIELSPFGYNETVAQEYFPLSKEEALERGYHWKDEDPSTKYEGPKVEIPNTIAETPDSICDEILECETCAKNYRIIKPELAFYRKMNLPIPHECPNCRHKRRMGLRNPRKLYERNCSECQIPIETTFSPEKPEKVLCQKCYERSVY